MTNEQESHLSMYWTVMDFSSANSAIIENLPNYLANLMIVTNAATQIQTIGEQQKLNKTGITAEKNHLRANLITLAADNARKLTAYAKLTNNLSLMGEVNLSESEFIRCTDTALKDYTQIIYDRAQDLIMVLAGYSITEASQATFLQKINTYNAILAQPRMGITARTQATKQLATLFKTADAALADMDAVVEIVRLSQANFYNGYKTTRKIIVKGTGTLMVKGTVTDAKTSEPLKGVTIAFTPNPNKADSGVDISKLDALLMKRTAEKGGFNVKSLPEGVYSVSIKKNGYKEQVVTLAVTNGEMSELNVELERS